MAAGVTAIFETLLAGASFIINDVFIELIIGQLFLQPIVWVGASIGIGMMLFKKFKNPLR